MQKYLCIALLAAAASSMAAPQAADPTRAYIDAGFAAMDANRDGKVTRSEFDRFMRARLTRQTAAFDAAYAQLDADSDGKITQAEAASNSQLAQRFDEVDANKDGSVDKEELRAAMLRAHAQEQGIQ